MSSNNKIIIAVLILVLVAVGVYYLIINRGQTQMSAVSSFEECAQAGYPIMESFPEQCRTPDGRSFTREINTPPVPPITSPVNPGNGGTNEPVFCTMDAMLCPDGTTYVGRVGPNCEFAACPGN